MNMKFKRKLPIPKEIKEQYPVSDASAKIKAKRDREIADVFCGKSDKFLMVIGPCSADNEKAVLDYIEHLTRLYERVSDRLILIPRIYTNKPRTSGCGYMGMLHQPNPQKSPDLLQGIIEVRSLHLRALSDYGFTCADELLYPENHRYLSDLLSYVAVGARSVENQQHRLTASGLNIPVGMKNPIRGDMSVMINAVKSAQSPHTFLYCGWEVESSGNPLAHAVLRGDNNGPNYDLDNLKRLIPLLDVQNPSVIVDTNHANSQKHYERQVDIALDVINSRKDNEIKRAVKGLMIESYLKDGCQDVYGTEYGKSITDGCLGWEKTEKLLLEIADKL